MARMMLYADAGGKMMSMRDSIYRSAIPEDGENMADGRSKDILYRVVLEGIKSDIETPDSFSIKYGILTSTPVTRIKFMMRNLPKTILETRSAPRAHGGGIGMLEEYDPVEKPKVEITEEEPTIATVEGSNCLKCGFPLKKDDEYCQFCHTPLVESKMREIKTVLKAGGGNYLVHPKRMLFYLGLVLAILIFGMLTR
jgi:hypothetical protein